MENFIFCAVHLTDSEYKNQNYSFVINLTSLCWNLCLSDNSYIKIYDFQQVAKAKFYLQHKMTKKFLKSGLLEMAT